MSVLRVLLKSISNNFKWVLWKWAVPCVNVVIQHSEVMSLKHDLDKQKEVASAAEIKIKWNQNKLKAEQDAHKVWSDASVSDTVSPDVFGIVFVSVWVRAWRIDPLHLLAGWYKRHLNRVLVSFGFVCVHICSFYRLFRFFWVVNCIWL